MAIDLPIIGQPNWGEPLNAALRELDSRVGVPGEKGEKGDKGDPGTVTPNMIALRDESVTAKNDAVAAKDTAVAAAQAASVKLDNGERGLRTFHAALGRRNEAPVRVIGLGHSFMEGEGADAQNRRWWEQFQWALRSKFPMYDGSSPSGRGFMPAFYKSPSLPDPAKTGTTTEVETLGIGGRTLYMKAGSTLTYNLTGTTVRVWYVSGATGSFVVTIDGAGKPAHNTSGTPIKDGQWVEYSLGEHGDHTVMIAAQSDIYIAGVEEFDGNESRGFQFVEAGHAGFKISDILAIVAGGGGDVNVLWNLPRADLYVIEYGVNEWVSGSVSPGSFRASLNSLVGKIRARAPLASILYLIDYQDLGTYTYEWSKFVQVYYDKAATDANSCVFDMTLRMPTASVGDSGLGLSVGDGHPSNAGHAAYAEYLSEFIRPR